MVYSKAIFSTSLLVVTLFFSAVCLRIMVVERPRRLFRAIGRELRTVWLTRERLAQGLPIVVLYMFFMASFSSMKSLIPAMQPYIWDPVWMEWDRVLHSGDPWRLTHALFGNATATFILNFFYNMWLAVMFAVLYWQAFSLRRPQLQRRFFLAFFLTWIVNGTVLAVMLSSAGPCFYALLLGNSHYAPLMERLENFNETYPIWALHMQDILWTVYNERGLDVGSGISAMPSVHVAVSFLLFLFGASRGRAWGIGFFLFFVTILIGSVHLGWHYAVDGYVAIAVTGLIWWLCGRIYPDKQEGDTRSAGQ